MLGVFSLIASPLAVAGAILPAAPAYAEYASAGEGLYKGSIDWFTWGEDGAAIPPEGLTKSNTRELAGQTITTTCSLSNLATVGDVPGDGLTAYKSGSWKGDALDNLYNGGTDGPDNTIVAGLANAVETGHSTFDFSCSVTMDDPINYEPQPVPFAGLVVADAEASNGTSDIANPPEYIKATPKDADTTWRVIDRFRPETCETNTIASLDASGTLQFANDAAECSQVPGNPAGSAGPMAVGFMDGATSAAVELKGQGRSAVALGVVLGADFGDAPDTYGQAGALFQPSWTGGEVPVGDTNVSEDAFVLGTPGEPTTRLGDLVDANATYLGNADATVDDADAKADEDGIAANPTISTFKGATYKMTVACTGPGDVVGWLDWNNDGKFWDSASTTLDEGEGSVVTACADTGTVDLEWKVPASAKSSTADAPSFLRLWITQNGTDLATPVGVTGSGEVEDYAAAVTISEAPLPVATDDTDTTPLDTPVTLPVLNNDTPGDPSTPLDASTVKLIDPVSGDPVDTVTLAGVGVYTVNPDGTVTFDPEPTFTGLTDPPVGYTVNDSNGAPATANITVTVSEFGPPVAKDDSESTPLDTPVTLPVLGNDEPGDPNAPLDASTVKLLDPTTGDPVDTVTLPDEGVYTVNPDGTVTFDPEPTFAGPTTPAVGYTVNDSNGTPATANITVIVAPPAPQDDSGSTPLDTPVTIPVLGNDEPGDSDAPVDPSTLKLIDPTTGDPVDTVTVPDEGVYTVNPDGTVSFDPEPTFTGPTTPLEYTVNDTNGSPATANITVFVAPPLAKDDSESTPLDTNVTLRVLDNDEPGDPAATLDATSVTLTDPTTGDPVATVTVPDEGVYTVNPEGTVTFDPEAPFTGPTTPLGYTVKDSNGSPATANITVFVDPPVAKDDSASTPLDTPVTLPVLDNDEPSDPAAPLDPSTLKLVDPTTGDPVDTVTVPGEGVYTVNPEGTVSFDPEPTFTGPTKTPVAYTVNDTKGSPATANITVFVAPPVANDDSESTPLDTPVTIPVLDNDTPGDVKATLVPASVKLVDPATGDPVDTVTVPGEGVYTVNPDGTVTFDPEPTFSGPATPVEYTVNDTNGSPAKANIAVIVAPPVAKDDSASTPLDTPVTVPVLGNDEPGDPAAPLDPSTLKLVDPTTGDPVDTVTVPGEGVYTVNPDGTVAFDPEPTFAGPATPVEYTVNDTNGSPAKANIAVIVAPPVAKDDSASTPLDTPVTVPVLDNDTPGDPSATLDPASVTLTDPTSGDPVDTVTVPGEGVHTVNPDGTVTFDPEPTYSGSATPVRYTVKDTNGSPATANIAVIIAPPVLQDDPASTAKNSPVVIPVLENDAPGDPAAPLDPATLKLVDPATGDPVDSVTVPGEGVFTVNPDGTITFTPEPGFIGPVTPVDYTVNDSNGSPAKGTITLTVAPPVALDDSDYTSKNTPVDISVLNNDKPGDPAAALDSTTVTLVDPTSAAAVDAVTVPGEGAYTANPNGTVTFDPEPEFLGTTKTPVAYTVNDVKGSAATAKITVTVIDGLLPVAADDAAFTPKATPVDVPVLANDQPGTPDVPLNATSLKLVDPNTGAPVDAVTVPGEGNFAVTPKGTIGFTPQPQFLGAMAPVTYTVNDANGTPAIAALTVTVVDGEPPVANPDTASTTVGDPVTADVLANDVAGSTAIVAGKTVLVDPNGAQVSSLVVVGEGSYVVAADGTITFTPVDGFVGKTTAVNYTITDENQLSATSTLVVTVDPAALSATGANGVALAILGVAGLLLLVIGGSWLVSRRREIA